jgi:hypothetical protein
MPNPLEKGTKIIWFEDERSRTDRLWGPPSFLSSGCRGESGRGMKLTPHLHLLPRSKMVELYLHCPRGAQLIIPEDNFTYKMNEMIYRRKLQNELHVLQFDRYSNVLTFLS